jgi:hypothetical protein
MLGIAKAAATTEMFENTCEIEIQFRLHGRIPPNQIGKGYQRGNQKP